VEDCGIAEPEKRPVYALNLFDKLGDLRPLLR